MNQYCRSKAAPEGSNLYYACLYQTPAARQRLYALFALYYELLESVVEASDPGVSRIKLQWWGEELGRLQAGRPRHPVTLALQPLVEEPGIDAGTLPELPGLMEALLARPAAHGGGWPRAGELAGFWRTAAAAAGAGGPAERDYAEITGRALVRLELLQNLRRLLALGFNPLPESELQRAGLTESTLRDNAEATALQRLAEPLLDAIQTDLQAAHEAFPGRPGPALLFALILNRLALATCREIRRDGGQLLSRRLALTPLRKLGIAVRTRYARLLRRPRGASPSG